MSLPRVKVDSGFTGTSNTPSPPVDSISTRSTHDLAQPEHHHAAETASAASSSHVTLDPVERRDSDRRRPRPPSTASHHRRPCFFDTVSLDEPHELATTRRSRIDKHLHSPTATCWPVWPSISLRRSLTGTLSCPPLPPFSLAMAFRKSSVPATPRVISPSPTPSELQDLQNSRDSYSGPMTRSAAKKRATTPQPVQELTDEDDYFAHEQRRSRTRSRSPIHAPRLAPLKKANGAVKSADSKPKPISTGTNGKTTEPNGHLAPPPATPSSFWGWRDFSRSPSPLGLIPIHRHWRTFIHKHEVPRKVLHVSIGFFTLWLYLSGTQTRAVTPWLMAALIPIATVDFFRLHYPSFNRFYVSVLGALMRESEYAGWNGVIFYLLGAFIVLHYFPKDVAMMGVLLLSWCDTAASTFGRLYGRYTPRIRRGKSLAGSLAAFIVGVATSWFFWGWLAPRTGPFPGDENFPFLFTGILRLPRAAADLLGLSDSQSSITGALALGVVSVWSGFVAAASEVVDLFGWDDNLTIPVLSGIGIWGFLKIFG